MLVDSEETYRELVDITVVNQEQFVNALKTGYSKQWKRETWLRIIGLMETWDMTC